jgi:formylglycine-generating enzyme required for sulfatase activity
MSIDLGHSFQVPNMQLPNGSKELAMLWIQPGTFTMGSRADEPGYMWEDGEPFLATLSKGFWLGQYPVTQAQWQAVMPSNPSHFQDGNFNRPVENVSWYDALDFCDQLNRRLASELPSKYWFSLPTEMQREFACRAGTQTPFYSGSSEADLARVAWYAGNSDEQTHPVGEKEANAWRLYDMHGNVGEWCYDTMGDYPRVPATDWIGDGNSPDRSMRGGAWGESYAGGGLRAGCRLSAPPELRQPWFGFRLCLRWFDTMPSMILQV